MYCFVNHSPCETTGGACGEEISEEQYNALLKSIETFDKVAPDGQYYQLQIDGTWELHELPPAPPVEDEVTPEELEQMMEAVL